MTGKEDFVLDLAADKCFSCKYVPVEFFLYSDPGLFLHGC